MRIFNGTAKLHLDVDHLSDNLATDQGERFTRNPFLFDEGELSITT